MNTRRKFLIQGSLATTAVLAIEPFNAIASFASPFTSARSGQPSLVFLHTAYLDPCKDRQTIQYIADIKKNNINAILLKATKDIPDEAASLRYDASMNLDEDLLSTSGEYKILYKGNIKIGIITAKPGENDVIQATNSLCTYLKKEKNCKIVVCLSQLGYKNNNAADDIKLAAASTSLDIIIGGHADNFHVNPIIAANSNAGEVIIHSSAGSAFGCSNIEIDLDDQGQKKHISFIHNKSKDAGSKRSLPAA